MALTIEQIAAISYPIFMTEFKEYIRTDKWMEMLVKELVGQGVLVKVSTESDKKAWPENG